MKQLLQIDDKYIPYEKVDMILVDNDYICFKLNDNVETSITIGLSKPVADKIVEDIMWNINNQKKHIINVNLIISYNVEIYEQEREEN